MTTAPDLRSQLFAAQDWYAVLVAGVDTGELSRPTPCAEFDVRMLMTHVGVVLDKIIGFATDHRDLYRDHELSPAEMRAAAEVLARERIDGRSASELAESVRAQTSRAREVWTDAVLDTPIQLGWGPVLPGRVVTAIYLMEVLSHAWDLATATGQPSEAPGGLGHAGLAAARAGLPAEPRGIEHGIPFGPVVESAPDAGPTEQMVNWTGRASR